MEGVVVAGVQGTVLVVGLDPRLVLGLLHERRRRLRRRLSPLLERHAELELGLGRAARRRAGTSAQKRATHTRAAGRADPQRMPRD